MTINPTTASNPKTTRAAEAGRSRGIQTWCKRQRVVGASRQRLWISSVPGLACQWLLTTWATKRILAGPLVDSFLQRLGWLALGQRFTLQELPATGPFGGHVAAGQQAVMPKTHELLGQDMQQEAANEFRRRQGHDLELVAVGIILVTKTDLSCVHRYQAAIGNGHAVAVTPQVAEHLRGAAERSLGVNYPVLAVPRIQPPAKNLRLDQFRRRQVPRPQAPRLVTDVRNPDAMVEQPVGPSPTRF